MNITNEINYPIIKEFESEKLCAQINEKHIIRVLGYENENVPEPVVDSVKQAFNEINQFVRLKGGYKIFDTKSFEIKKDHIKIESVEFKTGKIITANLRGSEYLSVIIVTIGNEITTYLTRLMETGDALTGYIADQIASEMVECWADDIENELSKYVNQSEMKITNRYSPGYCGWDVSDQHQIFSLLPENFCGVSLTENALMIPIKSISAIVGIGKKVEHRDYQCSICDMEFCYKRGQNE